MSDHLHFSKIDNAGIIILKRPKALNALNLQMARSIKKRLIQWKNNKNINCIIIKGIGNAFCAGGDIKSICLSKKNSSLRKNFFKEEYELNYLIKNFPKPYLAIWNGIVMGGGVGLSIYGKYRLATINTKFAMPESAIGFFPDVGTSYLLSRMKKSIGLFLALSGYVLNYYETYKLGLANIYANDDELINLEKSFIKTGKLKINSFNDFKDCKSDLLNNILLIDRCFSSNNIKDIIKSLKNDNSSFAKKILEILLKRCPMSLAITCEMIKRAKKSSFKSCLHMDYHLSQIMINREDFNNGVTEVLINKTHNQIWNPSSIKQVNSNIKKNFNNISTRKLNLDIL